MPPSGPATAVTGFWVDMQRTQRLLDEVFVHRGGIPDWDHWPDHSTVGIPNYYAWAYLALVQGAINRNESQAMQQWQSEAEEWGELGRQIPY